MNETKSFGVCVVLGYSRIEPRLSAENSNVATLVSILRYIGHVLISRHRFSKSGFSDYCNHAAAADAGVQQLGCSLGIISKSATLQHCSLRSTNALF